MSDVFEISGLLVLSATKFALAPGTTLLSGYNYFETIIITTSGGILGTVFFYYFGEFFIDRFMDWWNRRRSKEKVKKTFSKKNRLIVKTKISYGLIGLAVITPILLSIPIGSIVAARFFRHKKRTIYVLSASVIIWSLIITSLISFGFIPHD